MLIRVLYDDGRFDMVNQDVLDDLINQQVVTSFKREAGWAVVGRDQLRSSNRDAYQGMERRLA
jgi:hypothetical protein